MSDDADHFEISPQHHVPIFCVIKHMHLSQKVGCKCHTCDDTNHDSGGEFATRGSSKIHVHTGDNGMVSDEDYQTCELPRNLVSQLESPPPSQNHHTFHTHFQCPRCTAVYLAPL